MRRKVAQGKETGMPAAANMKKMVKAATNPGDKSSRNIVNARHVSIMAYHVRSIRFSVSA